jgi:hypothetical protein
LDGAFGRHPYFLPVPSELPSVEMSGFRFSKPENLIKSKKAERKPEQASSPLESVDFRQVAETIREFRNGGRILGQGEKSDYIVSADPEMRYGIKHLARPERIGLHETKFLKEEADLQWSAIVAADEWVAKNLADRRAKAKPGEHVEPLPVARVPEPYAYVTDPADPYPDGSPRQYMVMETIRGKTLSHLIYEKALEGLLQRREYADARSHLGIDDLTKLSERTLMGILADLPGFQGLSPGQVTRKLYDVVRGKGIVTEDQVRRVQRLVQAMNGKGLYHRDLHERNVIVDQGTGEVAVIDFGAAVFAPSSIGLPRSDQVQQIFTVPSENAMLPVDQDIATIMTNLTDRPISGPTVGRKP